MHHKARRTRRPDLTIKRSPVEVQVVLETGMASLDISAIKKHRLLDIMTKLLQLKLLGLHVKSVQSEYLNLSQIKSPVRSILLMSLGTKLL